MILEFFAITDTSKIADLKQVDALIQGEGFLQGLGSKAQFTQGIADFGLIQDVFKAFEMMTSQEIWELPEPWPFQYFPGIIEDESGRLQFENGLENDERLEICSIIGKHSDQFSTYLSDLIDKAYERHKVKDALMANGQADSNSELLEWIVSNGLRNEIDGYVKYIVDAICYAGLENTPVFYRLYEAFLTGGIPCGWVGAAPEDGGDPIKGVQLLHIGKPLGI